MEEFIERIITDFNLNKDKISKNVISRLIDNNKAIEYKKEIAFIKNKIIELYNMYRENEEFKEFHLVLPNASAKKNYEHKIDISQFTNIDIININKLENTGLEFDKESLTLKGTPLIANQFILDIEFFNKQDPNQQIEKREATLIVNADPKDLWKDLPSDKALRFSKEDTDTYKGAFLDKKIVIASKRGRSHAHEGSFRDDDFKAAKLPDNWEIIAVADGAGSAKYARQGSKIATEKIIEYFNNEDILLKLSNEVEKYFSENTEEVDYEKSTESIDLKLEVKKNIIYTLYFGVKQLFEYLNQYVKDEEIVLKDLNTTLIFSLVKKFDFGYVLLNFGVGDCPINVVYNNKENVDLLNTLDVGEFGGGTRFITMNEIYTKDIGSRFSIKKYENFDHLFLMTDGIYDPKFITENQLENIDTWKRFLDDLEGNNEDNLSINFQEDENIDQDLMNWLDFWSVGNHDDRTLAIVY